MISAVKLSLLLSVLSTVESNDRADAFNYDEQAYGILQVRAPAIDDVNRICCLPYSLEDTFNPRIAREVAGRYLELWCDANRQYSFEDAARIWNGGPDGWWKLSTLPYWRKVEAEFKRRGLDSRGTILEWQPPRTKQLPGELWVRIPGTAGACSSRSDLATPFRFVWNENEAKAPPSVSFTFTIKPSASKPVPRPASQPPTSRPVRILVVDPSFEIHWNDTR